MITRGDFGQILLFINPLISTFAKAFIVMNYMERESV